MCRLVIDYPYIICCCCIERVCVLQISAVYFICSYNSVNGVPSCANDFLQNEIVRGEWGFTGYIVSDCGAIDDIIATHQ